MVPNTINFYEQPSTMIVSKEMSKVNFGILRQLVVSAAVDNIDSMRKARRRLNQLQADPSAREQYQAALADFNALPEDVSTIEKMNATAGRMNDLVEMYKITVAWRDFFKHKYTTIANCGLRVAN